MISCSPTQSVAPSSAGFTLLEALVAVAILVIVVSFFLGTRTEAMIDAAEAQNWRIAREIGERQLSEIMAGANELPPRNRETYEVEAYPGFSYQVLIGEAAISDVESELAGDVGDPSGTSQGVADRVAWQRERESLRSARSSGVSLSEYEDQIREEEERLEDAVPSETEFEDVAVVVYFPNVRPGTDVNAYESSFVLKAKVSTLALRCMTPEQAETLSDELDESESGAGSSEIDR